MRRVLLLQRKILRLYLHSFIMAGVFLLYELAMDKFNYITFTSVALIGLIWIINTTYNKKCKNKTFMNYSIIKFLNLFVTSIMFVYTDDPLKTLLAFATIVYILELYIVANECPEEQKRMFVFAFVCVIVVYSMTIFIYDNQIVISLFTMMIASLYLYSLFYIFNDYHNEINSRLTIQTQLFEEAAMTNEELRKSQNKFKKIHEKVARQKHDLEVANKQLNKMTAEIYTQNELLIYISSIFNISELMDMVSDAIIGTIGVDTCSLIIFDEHKEEYHYTVKSNHPGDFNRQLIADLNSGYLQNYFEDVNIHLDNRVASMSYPFLANRPVGSLVIIPLLRNQVTYGLIIAEHSTVDMFTESNIQFFSGISTQITIAINNANLYALMEDMAIHDGLTGIYNRKYLIDNIDSYIRVSMEAQTSLSVALFDIDKFKSVNDQYGHGFGDEVIKSVAATTEMIAKKHGGIAIRYGGEEFVLVLPGKNVEEAEIIVKLLHENIKSDGIMYQNKMVNFNVSIGLSCYPELAENGENLLLRADNAMYYSKKTGRGKVTIDSKDIEKVV